MAFCLTQDAKTRFKIALKNREIDPMRLAAMESATRRKFLEKYVGVENALQVNSLFESKLLVENQKAGMIAWAKKVSGITPETKRDILTKIERLDEALSEKKLDTFLEDLATTRLGVTVTQTEANTMFELSRKMRESKAKMNKDFSWNSKKEGLEYGAARAALENYVNEIRTQVNNDKFVNPFKGLSAVKEDVNLIVKGIANNSRAFVASFDNSLWGNQGLRAALDPKYTRIWAKNFALSFKDIAQTLAGGNKKGDAILSAVKAEIYSRKNSLNGRYEMNTENTSKLAIGTGEEEIPTSLPSKIPVLGRFFKAAEVAYEAGAIRLRADIADKLYSLVEKNGIDMNEKENVGSLNTVINSITGRGRIGRSERSGGFINSALFSVRFLKSNIDFVTFHATDKLTGKARAEASRNIISVLATTAIILGIAKSLDDDSVDFDPRSSDFGKIKIGNTRFSVAPYASILTLLARILTQSTKSSTTGDVKKLGEGYGVPDGMDVFWDFTENKASPLFAILRDLIRQKTFEGEKPSILSTLADLTTPIGVGSAIDLARDTTSSTLLDLIGIGLNFTGINANTYVGINEKTKIIPVGVVIKNDSAINAIKVYAKALGTDPETAFNRIFTKQKIMQISNGGIIVVERKQSNEERAAFKKKYGAKAKEVKLDHKIPIKLGGSDLDSNTDFVPTSLWESYTPVETSLIRNVKSGKLKLSEAQRLIVKFKNIKNTKERKAFGEQIINKFK